MTRSHLIWTRFPLCSASLSEVTGSIPTAATASHCRVLEQECRAALYHCTSISYIKCERSDWTGAIFPAGLISFNVTDGFYYKMLQTLSVHGSIFHKCPSIHHLKCHLQRYFHILRLCQCHYCYNL